MSFKLFGYEDQVKFKRWCFVFNLSIFVTHRGNATGTTVVYTYLFTPALELISDLKLNKNTNQEKKQLTVCYAILWSTCCYSLLLIYLKYIFIWKTFHLIHVIHNIFGVKILS